jgi:XTP/dITP diphosphohydrolase
MADRIVLLVTSPRLPAGVLTVQAWDLLREASAVLAGAEGPQVTAIRAAGVPVTVDPAASAARLLSRDGVVVWVAGPTGDGDLARELGLRLAREPGLAELELVYGSWDPPGARLLDAVAVMDRLVSPGGDPWKREQTHQSLARFLLEECYEAYDAIQGHDLDALREELGDLLLQVVLHARLAADLPDGERWTVDDVAGGLVEKMIRRNPHVFGDQTAETVDEVIVVWEAAKRAEKARASTMDGIALSQPALALAAKMLSRSAALAVPVPDVSPLGTELFGLVAAAMANGEDAEGELRRTALAYAEAVRAVERVTTTPR